MIGVDSMKLKDLLDLEGKVQRAIVIAREREKAEVKQSLAMLAEKHGFSVGELFGIRKPKKNAKYVNPENRLEAWTGKGRKPLWLQDKLLRGAKLDDFAI